MALNFLNNGYFAGKVGIGETSPSYNLVVGDGTTDTESRFYHSDASYTSVRGYGLFMSRSNSYIRPVNDGSQTLYIGTDNNTWGTFSADANTFTLNRDGTSRLYINSSGNVGIGTTSPIGCLDIDDTFKLEGNLRLGDSTVYGGGWARGMITLYQNTSTGSKNFVRQGMLGTGDALSYYWHSMDTTTTTPWSVNAFRIYPNNNVIAGFLNGKVGIGTTNPQQKLQVASPSSTSVVLGASYASSNNNNFFETGINANDGYINLRNSGVSTTVHIDSDGNSYFNGGNVGIGTTSPDNISSTGTILSISTSGALTTNSLAGSLTFLTNDASFTNTYADGVTTEISSICESTTGAAYGLSFSTSTTTSSNRAERLRITSAGNVGIGTTSPSARLHVYTQTGNPTVLVGRSSGQSSIKASADADGGYLALDSSGNGLILNHYSSDNVWLVTGGGNVGVGNTGPSQKLHITGNLRVTGTYYDSNNTPGTSGQILSSTATGTDWIDGSAIPGVPGGSGTVNYLAKWTPDGDTLGIGVVYDNGTNVGIGTNLPGGKLDIAYTGTGGTGTFGIGEGLNISSLSPNITFNDNSTNVDNYAIHLNQSVFTLGRYTSSTSQSPDLVLKSGNVGIGTTSPGYKLHVNGGGLQTTTSTLNRISYYDGNGIGAYSSTGWGIGNYTGDLSLTNNADDKDIIFKASAGTAASAEIMRIDGSAGNVGIGTTSPGAKLEVSNGSSGFTGSYNGRTASVFEGSNSAGTTISIMSPNTGYSGIFFGNNILETYGQLAFDHVTNSFKFINGGGSERMRINSAGNVGIGTTAPSQKLHISGNMRLTGAFRDRLNSQGAANYVLTSTGSNGTQWVDASGSSIIGGPYLPLAGGTITGNLNLTYAYPRINLTDTNNDSDYSIINNDGSFGIYDVTNNSYRLSISAAGNATFAGDVTAPTFIGNVTGNLTGIVTATSSLADGVTGTTQGDSDDSELIATTAFVQNLIETIPAGLIFQGTWNAATNTPTLTSGSGTTGHFYIVSTSGSTNLDGITDWVTGDWAVFVEVGATDAWQKIDNSSVLDGSGTGQKMPMWAGSGTSNTLTDSVVEQVDVAGSTVGAANHILGTTVAARGGYKTDTYESFFQLLESDGRFRYYNQTGSGEQLTITQSGNVGIGTISPGNKLEVNGVTSFTGGTVGGVIDNHTAGAYLNTTGRGLSGNFQGYARNLINALAGGVIEIGQGTSLISQIKLNAGSSSVNGVINLMTQGSVRMKVASNGHVGIGTTNPSRALQVIGTDGVAKFYYNSSFTNAQYSAVDVGMMTSGTAANGFGPKITFRMGENGYDGYAAGTIGTIRNGADNTHNLNFGTSNSGSMTTKMTITNAGNVGIGTTSPENKLDILNNYAYETSTTVHNNAHIRLSEDTQDNFIANLNGGLYLSSSIQKGGQRVFLGDGATKSATIKAIGGSFGTVEFTTGSGTSGTIVSETSRMIIANNGNVGIGNTGPNYKLTVSGGIEAGGVVTYSKVAGSLNTTGYAIAGLGTVFNGASAFFTFTASGGTGQYQRIVYSCAGVGTNWVVYKVIDEGTNVLDIEASATSAATIVFTFKTRSGTQAYSPRVVIQATGHSIISTYA